MIAATHRERISLEAQHFLLAVGKNA